MFWDSTLEDVKLLLEYAFELEYNRRYHQATCAAIVASTIANVHRKKGARLFQLRDFVKDERKRFRSKPSMSQEAATSRWEELKAQLQRYNEELAKRGERGSPRQSRSSVRR